MTPPASDVPPADLRQRAVSIGGTDERRRGRLSARPNPDQGDPRHEAQRDCDRIVYSNAWRRLGAVTQVITPFDDAPAMHNRLTHSEKVARVARGIAERLLADAASHPLLVKYGGLDADVCEAAALAHDLGHPPFGHVGEETLDRTARASINDGGLGLADGFEGNAQSMRIVTLGHTRSAKYEGFDLTLATLDAIAKYPWMRQDQVAAGHKEKLEADASYRRHWKKFNFYNDQEPLLAEIRRVRPSTLGPETQSLEASVMDAADDISYAVHDLEDFYLSGILNMSDVRDDLEAFTEFLADRSLGERPSPFLDMMQRLEGDYAGFYNEDNLEEAAEQVFRHLKRFTKPATGDAHAYGEQIARGEGAKMIGRYISAVTVSDEPAWAAGPHIHLRAAEWHEVQILKVITKHYVIARPDFALVQRGQQTILESLVLLLREWVDSEEDAKRLPPSLREELKIARAQEAGEIQTSFKSGAKPVVPRGQPYRVILDYLCTLGDQQCVNLFQKLSGNAVHQIGFGSF